MGLCTEFMSRPLNAGAAPGSAAVRAAWKMPPSVVADRSGVCTADLQAESAICRQSIQLLEQLLVHFLAQIHPEGLEARPMSQPLHLTEQLPACELRDGYEKQSLPTLLGRCATQAALTSCGLDLTAQAVKLGPPPGLPPPAPRLAHSSSNWTGVNATESGSPLELRAASPAADAAPHSTVPELLPPGTSAPCIAALEVVQRGDSGCSVVWRIESIGSKLKASRGFPLLSPAFTLAGLPGIRLLFSPGDEWVELAGAATSRKQKRRRSKVKECLEEQLFGTLKVKAADVGVGAGPMQFQVLLGNSSLRWEEAGPAARCDFSEEVVQSCDIAIDWRRYMEGSCLALQVQFSPILSCFSSEVQR